MKYTKQNFSVRLIGKRYGDLWNDSTAWMEVSRIIGDNQSLKDAIRRELKPDFQNALLTPDTYLSITLIKPNRRITRYFDITLFDSVSNLVGKDEF